MIMKCLIILLLLCTVCVYCGSVMEEQKLFARGLSPMDENGDEGIILEGQESIRAVSAVEAPVHYGIKPTTGEKSKNRTKINPFSLFPPEFHSLLTIPLHVYKNGSTYSPHGKKPPVIKRRPLPPKPSTTTKTPIYNPPEPPKDTPVIISDSYASMKVQGYGNTGKIQKNGSTTKKPYYGYSTAKKPSYIHSTTKKPSYIYSTTKKPKQKTKTKTTTERNLVKQVDRYYYYDQLPDHQLQYEDYPEFGSKISQEEAENNENDLEVIETSSKPTTGYTSVVTTAETPNVVYFTRPAKQQTEPEEEKTTSVEFPSTIKLFKPSQPYSNEIDKKDVEAKPEVSLTPLYKQPSLTASPTPSYSIPEDNRVDFQPQIPYNDQWVGLNAPPHDPEYRYEPPRITNKFNPPTTHQPKTTTNQPIVNEIPSYQPAPDLFYPLGRPTFNIVPTIQKVPVIPHRNEPTVPPVVTGYFPQDTRIPVKRPIQNQRIPIRVRLPPSANKEFITKPIGVIQQQQPPIFPQKPSLAQRRPQPTLQRVDLTRNESEEEQYPERVKPQEPIRSRPHLPLTIDSQGPPKHLPQRPPVRIPRPPPPPPLRFKFPPPPLRFGGIIPRPTNNGLPKPTRNQPANFPFNFQTLVNGPLPNPSINAIDKSDTVTEGSITPVSFPSFINNEFPSGNTWNHPDSKPSIPPKRQPVRQPPRRNMIPPLVNRPYPRPLRPVTRPSQSSFGDFWSWLTG